MTLRDPEVPLPSPVRPGGEPSKVESHWEKGGTFDVLKLRESHPDWLEERAGVREQGVAKVHPG